MRAEWQTKPIGEAFRVVNGGTPKTSVAAYWDGEHYWITPAEMGGLPSPYLTVSRRKLTDEGLRVGAELVPEKSIILSTRAPIGHLVINEVPMAFNQGCRGLVPTADIDTKFAYYFMLANVPLLNSLGTGATFKELSSGKLKEVLFRFPPLPEQHRIVAILDEAFEGIATAKANAEKSRQNAREVFDSYLQSIVSEITDGWTTKTLSDVCEKITDGKHGDCRDEARSGYFFLSAKDVKDGTLQYEKARQITKSDFEETHRRTDLEPGDILMTNAGTIGRMAIAPTDDKTRRTTFQKSVAILKLRRESIDTRFAYYCLTAGLRHFIGLSAGAAQKNLLLRDLRSYSFQLPESLDLQSSIADRCDSVSEQTKQLGNLYGKKLAALEQLKKTLLHQAFTGQL